MRIFTAVALALFLSFPLYAEDKPAPQASPEAKLPDPPKVDVSKVETPAKETATIPVLGKLTPERKKIMQDVLRNIYKIAEKFGEKYESPVMNGAPARIVIFPDVQSMYLATGCQSPPGKTVLALTDTGSGTICIANSLIDDKGREIIDDKEFEDSLIHEMWHWLYADPGHWRTKEFIKYVRENLKKIKEKEKK